MDTKTLHQVSYGMYVVASVKGDKFNGQNLQHRVPRLPPSRPRLP